MLGPEGRYETTGVWFSSRGIRLISTPAFRAAVLIKFFKLALKENAELPCTIIKGPFRYTPSNRHSLSRACEEPYRKAWIILIEFRLAKLVSGQASYEPSRRQGIPVSAQGDVLRSKCSFEQ